MKVRWTGESLRLRITPGELAALERREAVAAALGFPGGGPGGCGSTRTPARPASPGPTGSWRWA